MGTGFFFTLSILPKLRWFSIANWQVRIFLFCFICAVVFHRDHCGESCAPSRNSSPSQKTVKNCCPIYKKAAEDTSTMGRVLGGIRLSGLRFFDGVLFFRKKSFYVFLSPNQFLHLVPCLAVVRVSGFLLGQQFWGLRLQLLDLRQLLQACEKYSSSRVRLLIPSASSE